MSDTHRRVYHPTLNDWLDVPKKDGDKWKAAGWRLTKPSHVDDSDAPKVGEGRGTVDIPREVPLPEAGSPLPPGTTTVTNTTGRAERLATGDTSS